ncbi:MAG: preprotein translocase subunit SecG [Armatimonadetes bacterium]|nr:preprotein translocase subunit SecG [Armatimonadota bacterium]
MLQYAEKEVRTMLTVFQIIQMLTAVTLITLTAVTQTKSEQGGGSMGWGTLGGKSSSSIAGLEDHLVRITTYAAVGFLAVSLVVAVLNV